MAILLPFLKIYKDKLSDKLLIFCFTEESKSFSVSVLFRNTFPESVIFILFFIKFQIKILFLKLFNIL